MKTLLEVRARLAEIVKEQRSMLDTAEEAKAELNEEESTKYEELNVEYNGLIKKEKLQAQLEEREADQETVVNRRYIPGDDNKDNRFSEQESRDINSFSFGTALAAMVEGRALEGVEKEMHEEGVKQYRQAGLDVKGNLIIPQMVLSKAGKSEQRDLTATGGSGGDQGGLLVQTNVGSLIERLRANLIVGSLGATQLSGLVGNIDFPVHVPNDAAVEKTENAAAAESSSTFSSKTMTPHRLPVHAEYSRQLLLQSQNESVENLIRDDLAFQIAKVIDASAINGSGSGAVPEGILNTTGIGSVVGGTNGAAPDWADIVNLETEVAIDNADQGALSYLTNPAVRGKLKQTFIDSSSNAERVYSNLSPNAPLNGYGAGISTQVPSNLTKGSASGTCSAIIFGNFRDLMIGQWGGLEFLVNPYTYDSQGLIRLNAWTFYDCLVRRAQSFAAMKDALTA